MKEEWKQVPGYDDYEVSNLGRVISYKYGRSKLLQIGPFDNGYCTVTLSKNGIEKARRVSELVLTTFIGPCPKGKETSHLNGNSKDDRLKNLAWETHLENMNRGIKYNTNQQGEKNGNAKLTEEDILKIKNLIKQGYIQGYIAGMFNVSDSRISKIKHERTWVNIKLA